MRKPKKPVIQRHHLLYACPEHKQKEVVVRIFKGEHFLINWLNRRTNISKGLIKHLKYWILMNEDNALDLDFLEEVEKERK